MRVLAILTALPLLACSNIGDDGSPGIPGSGTGSARTYQVSDFSKVSLRGSDDVDVRVGSAFSVRAEGDPEVLEYLKIEKDGDTLEIGRRNRTGFDWGGRGAKIFVTMPRIVGAEIAGSGDMVIDRAEGATFDGDSAGSGTIAIATLAVDEATFDVAGSGGVRAGGTAKSVKIGIAGSGDIAAGGLKANAADISIAGSGNVKLDVTGNAKVSIMGSGDVDLGVNAKCSVTKMGSGDVRCGG